ESGHLEDALHLPEVAERGLHVGEQVDGAQPGGGAAIVDREFASDLADELDAFWGHRNLPRDNQYAATGRRWDIVGRRRAGNRQGDAKRLQTGINLARHGSASF